MNRILIAALLVTFGCKKKLVEPPPVAEVTAPRTQSPTLTEEQAVTQIAANFERVNFALDSSQLTPASKSALDRNAELMARFPRIQVEVQGHADERGTTEYNLALGDRRAAAVREYLALRGVPSSRISTRSYGKELPLAQGSDEVAWAQNRRAEFRITVPEAGVGGTTR